MPDQEDGEPDELAPEDAEELARPGDGAGGDGAYTGWSDWVRRTFGAERFRAGTSKQQGVGETGDSQSGLSAKERAAAAKAVVNTLDARERRMGIAATVIELGLTALVVVPYLTHSHKLSSSELKTMSAVHVFLVEGLVLGAFLLLGTILRRRALLGFASLLVGFWLLHIKALSLLGVAYLGFGMWLVFKVLKQNNKQGRTSARGTTRTPKAEKQSKTNGTATVSRSAPKPNKRYTPPKASSRPAPKKTAPARAEPPKS